MLIILLLFYDFSCWRLSLFSLFIFVMWLAWHAVVGVFDYPIFATKEMKNVFILSVFFLKYKSPDIVFDDDLRSMRNMLLLI